MTGNAVPVGSFSLDREVIIGCEPYHSLGSGKGTNCRVLLNQSMLPAATITGYGLNNQPIVTQAIPNPIDLGGTAAQRFRTWWVASNAMGAGSGPIQGKDEPASTPASATGGQQRRATGRRKQLARTAGAGGGGTE